MLFTLFHPRKSTIMAMLVEEETAVAEPSAKAASVPIFRLGVDATWRDYQPNYDDHVKR